MKKVGIGAVLLVVTAVIAALFFPTFSRRGGGFDQQPRMQYHTEVVPASTSYAPQERYLAAANQELKRLKPLSTAPPNTLPLPAPPADKTAGSGSKAPALARKIIYTAELDLVASDLSKAERELRRWVKALGGYVSGAEVSGASGSSREGTWTVRIPVSRFDAFVVEVSRLGEVQSTNTQSEDVSEEFYDLGARLGAKRVEEARLLKHLQRSTTRLTDILAVEREISRVHTEIDQMEGRLRFLTNQTDFTTVTVTLHEAKGYTPPVPATLGTQIGRTWGGSVHSLAVAGKAALLAGVALLPWLVLIGLPLLALGLWIRRRGWLKSIPIPAE